MSQTVSPPAISAPVSRSVLVTLLGWVVIVGSGLFSTISFITCLMFIAGSYGTAGGMTLEGLAIIAGPPVTFVAGIGLLRRWRWAHLYMVVLLIAVLAWNGVQIMRGPTPQSMHVSAEGVRTTVLASPAMYSIPVIAICVGLLVLLIAPGVRAEFRSASGLKPALPPDIPKPQIEAPQTGTVAPHLAKNWEAEIATPKQIAMLGLFVIAFIGLAGWMGWLVNDAVSTGQTTYPHKQPSLRHSVVRDKEPAMFWTVTGLYAVVGAGSAGAAIWFISMGCKEIGKIRRGRLDGT